MNNKIRPVLKELLTQETIELIYDPQRFENLLKDHAPDMKSEVYLLVNSLKEEIPQQIKKLLPLLPKEQLINQLSHSLSSSLFIQKEASDWIIQVWYSILKGSEKEEEEHKEKEISIPPSNEEYPQFFFTKNNTIISFFENDISCMNTLMDHFLWIHSFQDEIIKKVTVNDEFCLVTTNKNVICIDVNNGTIHSSKSFIDLKTIPKQTDNDKIPIQNKESTIIEKVLTIDYLENNIKLLNSKNNVLLVTDMAVYKVNHDGPFVKKLAFQKQVKFLSVKDDIIVYSDINGDLKLRSIENDTKSWTRSFPDEKMIYDPILVDNNVILFCKINMNDLRVICFNKNTGDKEWSHIFSFTPIYHTIFNDKLFLFTNSLLIKINIFDGAFNQVDMIKYRFEKVTICNNNIIYFIEPFKLRAYYLNNEFDYDITEYRYNFKKNEPFVFEKSIIFSLDENNLICLDTKLFYHNYKKRWQIQIEGVLFQEITRYEDMLFLITDKGYLYSISQRSGKINWSYSTNEIPFSKPIVTKTHLFVITTAKNNSEKSNLKEKFKLLCLDKNSGFLFWSANIKK